ncbi:Hypothetical protein NTJ_03074 [Nesidiocoris tenuis]|uniref:Uncharacterized protein n=1 Tax=Nesidiocoris tenuis TaxID=355587 RepID=A0ABN7AD93_9HEMI|nr:Hypothetical protein NTJ_03074 [Nesidiocoris tenuis]
MNRGAEGRAARRQRRRLSRYIAGHRSNPHLFRVHCSSYAKKNSPSIAFSSPHWAPLLLFYVELLFSRSMLPLPNLFHPFPEGPFAVPTLFALSFSIDANPRRRTSDPPPPAVPP